jgi:hypothetical protein
LLTDSEKKIDGDEHKSDDPRESWGGTVAAAPLDYTGGGSFGYQITILWFMIKTEKIATGVPV